MSFKRLNTSSLMTFECCFLISQYHENCNAISSFVVLRHVPWNTFICSAVQCFHQFVMVFIYCLLSCVMVFIYCLLSFLVMQQTMNTVSLLKFQQNFQFLSVIFKRSKITIKKYVIFKNRNMQLKFEIAMTDIRDWLMMNDKLPELS